MAVELQDQVIDNDYDFLPESAAATTLDQVKDRILNFEVFESPLKQVNPITGELEEADHKMTYRIHENDFVKLGEVGYSYKILQNNEWVDNLRFIEESGKTQISTAGSILNGAKTWVLFKLLDIEPVPGDIYHCYLMAFNSHDGSTSVGYCATSVRVMCRNTWKKALDPQVARILAARHTVNVVSNLEIIRQGIDLLTNEFKATEEQLYNMAQLRVESEEQIQKVVKVVFDQTHSIEQAIKKYDMTTLESMRKPRTLDDVINLFYHGKGQELESVKGTGLALFNAITEYTNHYSGNDRKDPSTPDSRLNSVLFGPGSTLNNRAAEAVVKILSEP